MPQMPKVLEGIDVRYIKTDRIKMHVHFSKKEGGTPIMFIHENFSGATYFEETILNLPSGFFGFAPDLRGYGLTEDKIIDATRGTRDWSDDINSLIDTLNFEKLHIIGWSMGAGAGMQFLIDHPEKVMSLTIICPVSPFGFGGTKDEKGTPCYEDFSGSGGGTVNPDFAKRIKEGDRGEIDPNSPKNVINNFYYKPPFRAKREEDFLSVSLLEKVGDDRYPGDFIPSTHWPYVAPGKFGPINAMSPKYLNVSQIINVLNKPPILWVRGAEDMVISDNSFFDLGNLGKMGFIPNYPGDNIYPPQPMISQTRKVLETYKEKGGEYFEAVIKDAAHSPHIEKPDKFMKNLFEFISGNT